MERRDSPNYVEGLRVTVEGDLPQEVLERVAEAVRQTALREVAELDLAPALHEVPLEAADFAGGGGRAGDEDFGPLIPILLGIWFKKEDETLP
jgi:hypothetical protein